MQLRAYEPEHVGHNEEAHMRSANVDSIQMCDSPISLCDVDVLELDVHVVLSYSPVSIHANLCVWIKLFAASCFLIPSTSFPRYV